MLQQTESTGFYVFGSILQHLSEPPAGSQQDHEPDEELPCFYA